MTNPVRDGIGRVDGRLLKNRSAALIESIVEGEQMQKVEGIFDNRDAMQRESWVKGELKAQWPAIACADMNQTLTSWERRVLEKPWGYYPNPPLSPK